MHDDAPRTHSSEDLAEMETLAARHHSPAPPPDNDDCEPPDGIYLSFDGSDREDETLSV